MIEKRCETCGTMFELEESGTVADTLLKFVKLCPPCREREGEKRKEAKTTSIMQDREAVWRELCPPLFHDTDIAKLPRPEKTEQVLKWSGERGLLLHGQTRKGKSRSAWLLLRREFDKGRSIRVLDTMSGFEYGSTFSIGAKEAEEWVKQHCQCSILFMDDVFKVKLTDSFEAALFAILDYRLNHKKVLMATCNDTGDSLTARMSTDRGAAFVARLKECCDTISF